MAVETLLNEQVSPQAVCNQTCVLPKAHPRMLLHVRVGYLGTRASGGRRDRRSPRVLLSGSLNS